MTDIGIDQVQIYSQPNNDFAALKWVSPTSGCGLTNAEHVIIKVKNVGLAAQSNIPVYYSINGGTTFIGPEYITGPVNPGDTGTITFSATSNFSNAGTYNCIYAVKLPNDAIALNDSAFINISSTASINSFPFTEDFNTGSSSYLTLSANADAGISYDTKGVQNTYGLHFTGKSTNAWASGPTTAAAAWSYTTHQANAVTCEVDATSVSTLNMKFDIKETTSSGNNLTYTWFAVIANGTDTLADGSGNKYFNPNSAADDFSTKIFDLSTYAQGNFSLKFISSCRRDSVNSTNQIGDNVFFDNLALYVPPVINDLGPDMSICQGNSVTLDAGAGTGYTYLWTVLPSGDTLGTDQTLIVNNTGTYYVVVTNSLGYSAADAVTITVVPPPAAFAGNDTTINYQTAATLHGSVVSGTGTYTYSWTPANLLEDANVQNPTTVSLSNSTIFTLYVADVTTGCVGTDQVIVLNIGGPLSVDVSASPDTICAGEAISLLAIPSGGSGNYTYSWASVPFGFTSTDASAVDNPIVNTTYNVSLSDGTNTAISSVAVVVHALPIVYLGNDTIICNNKTITLSAGSAASYMWSTGENTQSIVVDSTAAVSGTAVIWCDAISSFGCSNTDTIIITFDPCSGINEYNNNTSISLYPNPTSGITSVVINGFSNAVINIYNMQGVSVFNENIKANNKSVSKQFDFSNLPKGLYLIRVSNENTSKLSKLIIL